MNGGIKHAFSAVKDEMNQHLDAINQNTNEIQSCYEYLAELDAKMTKLSERLDDIQYQFDPNTYEALYDVSLTHREQEVFMVLYTLEDPVTAQDIARRLGLSLEMVEQYLMNLSGKGIPLLKTLLNGKLYHALERRFKELQAKRNILNINEAISAQLLNERAI